jgi:HD-like signal output (HDOD) protein/CheY-like chemotaxis protein
VKKRILFVGEDQPLRQEFRDHVADPASNWTVEFARTGAEALALADRHGFDAAVVDVELSGMNGADLLDQFMRRQPGSMRLILSDVADAQSTVKCVGRAHHHLFKPCNAATVINALNQALMLEAALPSDKVRALIAQMRWVPSPPAVYSKILAEMQSPNASVERIGALIARDPALTAKVLQLANSAVFGLHLQVTQPFDAVAYIGLETTRALVLLAHTFSSFDQLRCVGFSAESLWQHSLRTGQFARQIAELESNRSEVAEQAFSAGLLHDIGKLLFAANLPGPFGQALTLARSQPCSLWEAEQSVLDTSHPEVGACVLGIWGLPMPIVEAVALHHCPSKCAAEEFNPLTAVHAANALEHESPMEQSPADAKRIDLAYLKSLGLDQRIEIWRNHCLQSGETSVL